MSDTPIIDSANLLQITDTHLFAGDGSEFLGITPNQSFDSVLSEIELSELAFDAILATGDIAQDQSSQAYKRFVDGISRWSQPCYWLEGNHDQQDVMQSNMHSNQVSANKCIDVGANWMVVMLNSQVRGKPYGLLKKSQLDFLQSCIDANPQRHFLVCLHHHSVPVGSAWLDQHQLKNADEFWSMLEGQSQVKAVLCGHVHQDFDEVYRGIRVITTPSTCIQFKMNSTGFALDNLQPGWRTLTLKSNGELDTQVFRLQYTHYLPCLESTGY